MNDVDEIEAVLRRALDHEARQAPIRTPEWIGSSYAPSPARRGRVLVSAAAVAMLGAGVAVAIAARDSPDGPASPAGQEFPIGPSQRTSATGFTVKPGSLTFIDVPTIPFPLYAFTSAMYWSDGSVHDARCTGGRGSSGCHQLDRDVVSFGPGYGPDYGTDVEMITWDNVPGGAVYVTYEDGTVQWWQRPVGGMAVFPRGDGDIVLTAYGADGTVIGQASEEILAHDLEAEYGPLPQRTMVATLASEQQGQLAELAQVTLTSCLEGAGATFDARREVPTFAAGVDTDAVWSDCVDQTVDLVARRFAELGGRTELAPLPEGWDDPDGADDPDSVDDTVLTATSGG